MAAVRTKCEFAAPARRSVLSPSKIKDLWQSALVLHYVVEDVLAETSGTNLGYEMSTFPTSELQPLQACLFTGGFGDICLEVEFSPFDLMLTNSEGSTSLRFDTALRADGIELPSLDPNVLAGQVFEFPVNPEQGFIDASVYFANVHNPVDITRLVFGERTVSITSRWLMSFEGTGYDDFDFEFSVKFTQ